MLKNMKKRIFISYAHKDAIKFVEKLAKDLSYYLEVFWDDKLTTGEFPLELFSEIKQSDFFLFVMSKASFDSDWCKKELECAIQSFAEKESKNIKNGILLAKLHDSLGHDLEKHLESTYNFCDFRNYQDPDNYERGFGNITKRLTGERKLSWQRFADNKSNEALFDALNDGLLPVSVAKQIIDWVFFDKVWQTFTNKIKDLMKYNNFPLPKTIQGVETALDDVFRMVEFENNTIVCVMAKKIETIVSKFSKSLGELNSSDYQAAGNIAYNIILDCKDFSLYIASSSSSEYLSVENNFDFEVAEKIREIIHTQAMSI